MFASSARTQLRTGRPRQRTYATMSSAPKQRPASPPPADRSSTEENPLPPSDYGDRPPRVELEPDMPRTNVANAIAAAETEPGSFETCNDPQFDYTHPKLRKKLWNNTQDREEAFGYNYLMPNRVLQNYNASYFENKLPGDDCNDITAAPRDYYFDTVTNSSIKNVIGDLAVRPNLYNDELLPNTTNTVPVDRRNYGWQPLTTSATPVLGQCRVQFVPYENPVEVAPWKSSKLWVGDLNSRMYDRQLTQGAERDFYKSWGRRQAMMNLISKDMPSSNDFYLKRVDQPSDAYACANRTKPPAVTSF